MEKEKQDAAYKFVDSMISQHDGKIGNKHFWFGWALREAFLSGIKYVSQPTITKPPLGIMPKTIHDQKRAIAILEAMLRYVSADKTIPAEWINELICLYGVI